MYLLIVNSNAGDGNAGKVFERIQKTNSFHNVKRITVFTNKSTDAEKIAENYSKNTSIKHVIVIGGDGTLHEVMNGWSNEAVPVSFIPGGSGNDFAKGIDQHLKAEKQWEKIISNPTKESYWNGLYQLEEKNQEKKFINSIGMGIDAKTTEVANQSRFKVLFNYLGLGKLIYLTAFIQAVWSFQPMTIRLQYDGKRRTIQNAWMITAANHPYSGGGLKLVPHAKISSEQLSILIIHQISRKKVLMLFLLVIFGQHRFLKEVELLKVKEITIQADALVSYQADGEIGQLKTCRIKKEKQAVHIYK
ncbi:diacylglycerol/lipid kinase family protein [Oceanobacillus jeddahense]|uniref:Diacylglycerol kinase family lipid kinase n=1 Tax=Oceanobacillus jeddahense TaxID=1462527 RepID=A0ABY5JRT0_9BACI|nr:diacylglycerol kinase family protein [Oceanobacillus jeddahense]UUI01883.1 diacylglycerol kinase family lipid kinase [Oceanobacillus jeddahense]